MKFPQLSFDWQSAELYRSDVFDAWHRLQEQTAVRLEEELTADAGGTIVRRLHEETTYESPRFRLVLLPVWICGFQYGGRRHRFLVNGHSGTVTGTTPTSRLALPLIAAAGAGAAALMTIAVRGCGP